MPFIVLYVIYKHSQAQSPELRSPNCPDDEDSPIASRFDHHATALSVKQWYAGTFLRVCQITDAELQAVAHPGVPNSENCFLAQQQQQQQQGAILNDTDRLSSLPGCHIQ